MGLQVDEIHAPANGADLRRGTGGAVKLVDQLSRMRIGQIDDIITEGDGQDLTWITLSFLIFSLPCAFAPFGFHLI